MFQLFVFCIESKYSLLDFSSQYYLLAKSIDLFSIFLSRLPKLESLLSWRERNIIRSSVLVVALLTGLWMKLLWGLLNSRLLMAGGSLLGLIVLICWFWPNCIIFWIVSRSFSRLLKRFTVWAIRVGSGMVWPTKEVLWVSKMDAIYWLGTWRPLWVLI